MQEKEQSRLRVFLDSDLVHSFKRSPTAICATIATLLCFAVALFAPLISPHCVEPICLDLMNGLTPPAWSDDGVPEFLLGTDEQGRDILSGIFHASRISLTVGFAAVGFGMFLGVSLGVIAGYFGGWVEIVIMRITDIALAIPPLVMALAVATHDAAIYRRSCGSLAPNRPTSAEAIVNDPAIAVKIRPNRVVGTP